MVKCFDDLPWIVKLIFALPILDGLLWGIYRVLKGAKTGNMLMLVVGIVWIFAGAALLWIIDLVCVILYKKPVVLA